MIVYLSYPIRHKDNDIVHLTYTIQQNYDEIVQNTVAAQQDLGRLVVRLLIVMFVVVIQHYFRAVQDTHKHTQNYEINLGIM